MNLWATPLQCGLPKPNLKPQHYELKIVDLKDCFFTIPLAPQDRENLPLQSLCTTILNLLKDIGAKSCLRECWIPQLLCQHFVELALQQFLLEHTELLVYHYMDDILVAGQSLPNTVYDSLANCLEKKGLHIAPEKIQTTPPFPYLGHKLLQATSSLLWPELKTPSQFTLVQLQQFLGHLNWACPFLCLSTPELQPLFNALQGHQSPADSMQITKGIKHTIHQINAALRCTMVHCIIFYPLQLVVLNNPQLPHRLGSSVLFLTYFQGLFID